MNVFEAVQIVEDTESDASEENLLEAWQFLHDSGYAYTLQGTYGRIAQDLVEAGLING